MTSPLMLRCMSVTSSGRSSISSTIRCTSGYWVVMALATFFKSVVLPALGWDTIMPRWPLPMGASMSISRSDRSALPSGGSSRSRSSG